MNNSQKLLIQKNIENYSFKTVKNDSSKTIFFLKIIEHPYFRVDKHWRLDAKLRSVYNIWYIIYACGRSVV